MELASLTPHNGLWCRERLHNMLWFWEKCKDKFTVLGHEKKGGKSRKWLIVRRLGVLAWV